MKKKKFWKKLPVFMAMFLPCVVIGAVSSFMVFRLDRPMLMEILVMLLGWYLGFMVQILVHELGHMMGGFISGYKFCSFRIGSVIFVKQHGRINIRRFSLAGTGGQCLMSPPDMNDGDMPTTLYNLSGVIANVAASAVCAAAYLLWGDTAAGAVIGIMGLFGLYFAITNGIPMNTGMLDNDGKNALSMRSSVKARRALWLQLKVNEMTTEGMRLKDMPEEWFELPSDEDMKNPLISAVGILCCAKLVDELRLDEADALMRRFLHMRSGINPIHRAALVCDRIFIELINENRPPVVKRLLTPNQQKIMRAMKSQLSVLRTEYGIKLLRDNDAQGAEKILNTFEKIASKYPNPQEAEAERELIALADAKYGEIQAACEEERSACDVCL